MGGGSRESSLKNAPEAQKYLNANAQQVTRTELNPYDKGFFTLTLASVKVIILKYLN